MNNERELIDTGTDKRFVRRREDDTFKESVDVSKSLSQDARKHAETKKPRNQGTGGIEVSGAVVRPPHLHYA